VKDGIRGTATAQTPSHPPCESAKLLLPANLDPDRRDAVSHTAVRSQPVVTDFARPSIAKPFRQCKVRRSAECSVDAAGRQKASGMAITGGGRTPG
jgi:hypothetical protein